MDINLRENASSFLISSIVMEEISSGVSDFGVSVAGCSVNTISSRVFKVCPSCGAAGKGGAGGFGVSAVGVTDCVVE